MADEDDKKETEDGAKGGSSTIKVVIIAVVAAVILSGGLVGATFYFLVGMDGDKSADPEAVEEVVKKPDPPKYHSLDPKFVVSFKDSRKARFMQFSIDAMTRDSDTIKKLEEHSPAIRSSLLMLFDGLSYEQMSTKKGKNDLLIAIVDDINNTIKSVTGQEELESPVEAAYFTEFVIQ